MAVTEADAGTGAKSVKTGVRDASLVVQLRELWLDRRLRLRLRLRGVDFGFGFEEFVFEEFERFEGRCGCFYR